MRGAGLDRKALGPALAGLAVLAIALLSWPYAVDDAFVVARYAEHVASGVGWRMNAADPPTDGVTGPLAIVPGLLAAMIGLDAALVGRVAGAACGALAAALACRAAARHALGGPTALTTGVLASCNATVGIWSGAGLETGMATLAATVAVLATIARPSPRGVTLGVAIAALAWLRPECAVLAAALLAACYLRDRRRAGIALALAIGGALGVVAFRLALFGAPLPLAWDAKPAEVGRGLEYAARGLFVTTGLGGVVLAWLGAMRSRSLRLVGVALALHVVAVVLAGGDWMPGFRLLAPIVPSFALIAGIGGARAIALARGPRRRVAIALVVFAIGIPGLDALVQIPRAREAGETRERIGPPLARELAELAGDGRVALVDVGYLPWRGGFDVVDLGGITDPTIGRLPGRHLDKEVEPALLAERGASVIVLRSFAPPRVGPSGDLEALAGEPVERRLAASAWVRESFRVLRVVPWSGSYHYVVLVRGEPPQASRDASHGGAGGSAAAP
jgi:hypothetical protein